ncbi:MAG: FtsL-like putative cell division protein [Flavobacteriales bacterium]
MKPTNEVHSNAAPIDGNAATQTQQLPPKKKSGKGNVFQKILGGEFLAGEGLVKHLSFVLFLVFLFIANIGLVYYFENTAREKVKLQNELNELRSQYNTTMSDLEKSKQQSNVAQAIEQMGLKELRTPPQVIDVEQGFFDDKSSEK